MTRLGKINDKAGLREIRRASGLKRRPAIPLGQLGNRRLELRLIGEIGSDSIACGADPRRARRTPQAIQIRREGGPAANRRRNIGGAAKITCGD